MGKGRKIGTCCLCGKEETKLVAFGMCNSCYCKQHRKKQDEKDKERLHQYYLDHKEEIKQYNHQRYLENQEDLKARAIERRRANSEQRQAYDKEYRKTEAGRESTRKTKQKRKELLKENNVETIKLTTLYEKYEGICQYCGILCDWNDYTKSKDVNGKNTTIVGKTYPTCDHIIPINKGGENSYDNVVLACRGCNERKGAQINWKPIPLDIKGEDNNEVT